MTFWSCKKNGLTKKRLISKFMMPQPGKQLQYTLPNISRSKGNQTMKFGQVIEYNKRNIFLQKSRKGRLDPSLFLFFEKKVYTW